MAFDISKEATTLYHTFHIFQCIFAYSQKLYKKAGYSVAKCQGAVQLISYHTVREGRTAFETAAQHTGHRRIRRIHSLGAAQLIGYRADLLNERPTGSIPTRHIGTLYSQVNRRILGIYPEEKEIPSLCKTKSNNVLYDNNNATIYIM